MIHYVGTMCFNIKILSFHSSYMILWIKTTETKGRNTASQEPKFYKLERRENETEIEGKKDYILV